MRDLNLDPAHAPVYKALASEARLSILSHLSSGPANQQQLADRLGLSSAMVAQHLDKLAAAGLVALERVTTDRGLEKRARLSESALRIDLTRPSAAPPLVEEIAIPIGHFVDFSVSPPCGLATADRMIGVVDDPRYFFDPLRVDAGILWFAEGAIMYRIPVFHPGGRPIRAVSLSFEAGSEARGYAMDWPSRIRVRLNGLEVAAFVLPGDFGDRPGRLSPAYWKPKQINQYGILKQVRIDGNGTAVDGALRSGIGLERVLDVDGEFLALEFVCRDNPFPGGGLTLYGKDFGDFPQDIRIRFES